MNVYLISFILWVGTVNFYGFYDKVTIIILGIIILAVKNKIERRRK